MAGEFETGRTAGWKIVASDRMNIFAIAVVLVY
jgi:hypothetical protein